MTDCTHFGGRSVEVNLLQIFRDFSGNFLEVVYFWTSIICENSKMIKLHSEMKHDEYSQINPIAIFAINLHVHSLCWHIYCDKVCCKNFQWTSLSVICLLHILVFKRSKSSWKSCSSRGRGPSLLLSKQIKFRITSWKVPPNLRGPRQLYGGSRIFRGAANFTGGVSANCTGAPPTLRGVPANFTGGGPGQLHGGSPPILRGPRHFHGGSP